MNTADKVNIQLLAESVLDSLIRSGKMEITDGNGKPNKKLIALAIAFAKEFHTEINK